MEWHPPPNIEGGSSHLGFLNPETLSQTHPEVRLLGDSGSCEADIINQHEIVLESCSCPHGPWPAI